METIEYIAKENPVFLCMDDFQKITVLNLMKQVQDCKLSVKSNTKTIEVTDEMHAALMEISKELNTQDHLCTAMPYIFQIQTEHQIAVPEGNGIKAWFYDGSLIEKEDEITEAIYDYKDGSMTEKQIRELDEDDRDELMEKIGYRKVYYDYEKKCENAFFTKKGAEEHIRVNGHNLSNPQIYLNHAFRNAEMELVMSFLCELSGGKIHK